MKSLSGGRCPRRERRQAPRASAVEIGYDDVEAVVDHRVAVRLLVPVLDPAVTTGPAPRCEVDVAGGAAEAQEVCPDWKSSAVTVPPNGMSKCVCGSMQPGRTYFPGRVDHRVRDDVERRADLRDRLVLDVDVGDVVVARRDDPPALIRTDMAHSLRFGDWIISTWAEARSTATAGS